jgi:hypothetical protein
MARAVKSRGRWIIDGEIAVPFLGLNVADYPRKKLSEKELIQQRISALRTWRFRRTIPG